MDYHNRNQLAREEIVYMDKIQLFENFKATESDYMFKYLIVSIKIESNKISSNIWMSEQPSLVK